MEQNAPQMSPARPPAPQERAPERAPSTRSRWAVLAAIALALLAADQVTKFLAVKHLTTRFAEAGATTLREEVSVFVTARHLRGSALPSKVVVPGFWSHHYAENPGAAWSFAATWPEHVRRPFFHVVSLLAIGLIAFYFHKLAPNQRLLSLALSLVMGGALGNLLDRLMRGYVIDFIDWHLNDHAWQNARVHWPTFNVADSAITVGVMLIALDSLLSWLRERREARAAAA